MALLALLYRESIMTPGGVYYHTQRGPDLSSQSHCFTVTLAQVAEYSLHLHPHPAL